MNFTLYKRQPLVKTGSTEEVSVVSNVYNNRTETYIPFKPQPIQHWRKQLIRTDGCIKKQYVPEKSSIDNKDNCGDCDPKKKRIRSGLTNKKDGKYYHNTSRYLESRVKSCDTNYSVPNLLKCSEEEILYTPIEKYNNSKYSQQGAVSSSTRIMELNRTTISVRNTFIDRNSGICSS